MNHPALELVKPIKIASLRLPSSNLTRHPFCCPSIQLQAPSNPETSHIYCIMLEFSDNIINGNLTSPPFNLSSRLAQTNYIIKLEEYGDDTFIGTRYFMTDDVREELYYPIYVDVLDDAGGEEGLDVCPFYMKFRCEGEHVGRYWNCWVLARPLEEGEGEESGEEESEGEESQGEESESEELSSVAEEDYAFEKGSNMSERSNMSEEQSSVFEEDYAFEKGSNFSDRSYMGDDEGSEESS